MYLLVITVPGEREQRLKTVESRTEAAAYVFKLKEYVRVRYKEDLVAEVYNLGTPIETFK